MPGMPAFPGMNAQGQGQDAPNPFATPGGMPPLPMPFMNPALLGMMGASPAAAAATANQQPPEERFQVQLRQLQDMVRLFVLLTHLGLL